MKKNQYTFIIAAILIAGLSFFAGTRYQLGKTDSSTKLSNARGGQNSQRTGGTPMGASNKMGQNGTQSNGLVNGEITAKDEQSLTVKLKDGSTKIIIVADSTSYKVSSDASAADLSVGETVTIVGTSNTDGSVTAKTVTVGESMMPMGGVGRPEDMPTGLEQTTP
jgi:hypothetical protein